MSFGHVIAVCCGPHILPYLTAMQVATSYNRNLNPKTIAAFVAQSYHSNIVSMTAEQLQAKYGTFRLLRHCTVIVEQVQGGIPKYQYRRTVKSRPDVSIRQCRVLYFNCFRVCVSYC